MARNTVNNVPGNKPRKSVVIFGLLVVAGGAAYHFSKSPPKTKASASTPSAAPAPAPAAANNAPVLSDMTVDWEGVLARDLFDTRELTPRLPTPTGPSQPTAPDPRQQAAADAKANIHLQATLNGETKSALINGQMCSAGDRVRGFTIVEILDNRIIVERQGILVSIISE